MGPNDGHFRGKHRQFGPENCPENGSQNVHKIIRSIISRGPFPGKTSVKWPSFRHQKWDRKCRKFGLQKVHKIKRSLISRGQNGTQITGKRTVNRPPKSPSKWPPIFTKNGSHFHCKSGPKKVKLFMKLFHENISTKM